MKNRIRALTAGLAVAAAALVSGLVVAAPAQAFTPIVYTADCPTNSLGEDADWQQLVIQNWSGDIIAVSAWEDYPNGNIKPLGSTLSGQTGGQVTYFPGTDGDVVQYTLTGPGNVNWFYHVDCFY